MSYQELQEFLNKKRVESWRKDHGYKYPELTEEDQENVPKIIAWLKKVRDNAEANMKNNIKDIDNSFQNWKKDMAKSGEGFKAGGKELERQAIEFKDSVKEQWKKSDEVFNKRYKWFIEFLFGKGTKL